MKATQGTFSKIIDPLTDNIRELQKITGVSPTENFESTNTESETPSINKKEELRKKSKKSPSFEDYLR